MSVFLCNEVGVSGDSLNMCPTSLHDKQHFFRLVIGWKELTQGVQQLLGLTPPPIFIISILAIYKALTCSGVVHYQHASLTKVLRFVLVFPASF